MGQLSQVESSFDDFVRCDFVSIHDTCSASFSSKSKWATAIGLVRSSRALARAAPKLEVCLETVHKHGPTQLGTAFLDHSSYMYCQARLVGGKSKAGTPSVATVGGSTTCMTLRKFETLGLRLDSDTGSRLSDDVRTPLGQNKLIHSPRGTQGVGQCCSRKVLNQDATRNRETRGHDVS